MNGNPQFSIVLPIHNVAPYLSGCLDSVLAQDFTDWECICIDDGSRDGSADIVRSYARRDARIRLITIPASGVSRARNVAIREAHGEYVGFLDGDDVWSPHWLRSASELVQKTGADLIRQRYVLWQEGTPCPEAQGNQSFYTISNSDDLASWGWPEFLQSGQAWLYAVRRTCLEGASFCENLSVREDVIFALSLLPKLTMICQSEYQGYFYRLRHASAWHTGRRVQDAVVFVKELNRLWQSQQKSIVGSEKMPSISAHYTRAVRDNLTEWIDRRLAHEDKDRGVLIDATLDAMASSAFDTSALEARWRFAFVWLRGFHSVFGFQAAMAYTRISLAFQRLAKRILMGGK